jgi:hypothetical protein
MPSFMTGKRSRLITIAAAGTVTVATAVSATAAALPSGSAAVSPVMADSHVLVNQHQVAARAAQGAMMSEEQRMILITRARYALAERQREREAALARAAAARKAAAAKAAAARAAAARAAAQAAAVRQAAAAKAAAAKAATQQQAAQQQAAQPQAASAPSGSPQQIAEQMLSEFGWSSGQFSCLQPLWDHESGWNPYAQNPSSGAYGIPQALPGSKMASVGGDWQSNPATQIRWGLSYIQGSYGSPCGAWAHEQSDGWY